MFRKIWSPIVNGASSVSRRVEFNLLYALCRFDANAMTRHGKTVLHMAVEWNDMALLQFWLALPGVDVNQLSEDRQTPLYNAIRMGNEPIFQALLAHPSIDINAKNILSTTALELAIMCNRETMVDALLEREDIEYKTVYLSLAIRLSQPSILIKLFKRFDLTPSLQNENGDGLLHYAVCADKYHQAMWDFLLALPDIDINMKNWKGETPLMLLAYLSCNSRRYNFKPEEYRKITSRLLQVEGIDVNLADNQSMTPLMIAARCHDEIMLSHLLAHPNIESDKTDSNGNTALICAASRGYVLLLPPLLKHRDVNIDHQNTAGYTALMYASVRGHEKVVDMLLAHQADVTLKNTAGKTAYDLASTLNIVRMLDKASRENAERHQNVMNLKLRSSDNMPHTVGEKLSFFAQSTNADLSLQQKNNEKRPILSFSI